MAIWEKLKEAAGAIWEKPALIGAVVAAFGVFVAYEGLIKTATKLQGTTIYNVARDGKTLQRRYEKGEATPDEVMSYFFSVYALRMADVLDERAWVPIEIAMCNFIKSGPNVQQSWDQYKENYDKNFQDLVNRLRGKPQCG